MKINWKNRLKRKSFWVAIFSALLLATQSICSAFGLDITGEISDKATTIFNSVLTLLTVSGVIVDFSSEGLGDQEK